MKTVATLATIAVLLALLGGTCAAYDPNWTRTQAYNYAYTGLNERYVFGGDKWIDNDVWDSSSTEGCDCSGYTAKSFAIPNYTATNVSAGHPYNTSSYYNDTCPYTHLVDRSVGGYMTGWVYLYSGGGHTGLFISQNSDGTWKCWEAKGSSYGIVQSNRSISTLISSNNYRRYDRDNWGVPAADIIIDNTSSKFSCSAAWATGTGTGKYGTDYRWHSTQAISDQATWTPGVSGTYKIYAWWAAGTNRSTAAPYRITKSDGTVTEVKVNQQINGGKWNLLGTFTLNTSSKVQLSCWAPSGYVVIADAIKLTPQ